jgi:hypothetical protein
MFCVYACTGASPPYQKTFDACAAQCSPDGGSATFSANVACFDAMGCNAKCGK